MPPSRDLSAARIAVVHDWLDTWRGGENVLAQVLAAFPQAELHALVDFLPDALRPRVQGRHAHTSWLQHVPGARRHFRKLLPLFPAAMTSLDVAGCDIVISISHAVAKTVRTHPRQLHVCYCLTPMRYAWDLRDDYLAAVGAGTGIRRALADRLLDRLQQDDLASNARVDRFAAISHYIRARIARCYGRHATVNYPPVDTAFFTPGGHRGATYVTASRWVPYKRVDLVVAAFRALPERRLIVVGDGPEASRIRAAAGANVEFVGEVPAERLRDLLRSARAFVFAADEDFGMLPVEAQACGTPVIAYGRGGALETVRGPDDARPTGLFFERQTADAIAAAVRRFESEGAGAFATNACRANAERFSADGFKARFTAFVDGAWTDFTGALR